jgi:hypothetical protein
MQAACAARARAAMEGGADSGCDLGAIAARGGAEVGVLRSRVKSGAQRSGALRSLAIALAALLLASACASDFTLWACTTGHHRSLTPCCPRAKAPSSGEPALLAVCCVPERVAAAPLPPGAPDLRERSLRAAPVVAFQPLVLPSLPPRGLAPPAEPPLGPRPTRPPIFLLRAALLI